MYLCKSMKRTKADRDTTLLTVAIPSVLHNRWKIEAAKRKLSMAEMTAEAMSAFLAKPRRTNGHAQEPV